MNIYAVVNVLQGRVANIIIADSLEQARAVMNSVVEVTETTGPAKIGDWWDGTSFMENPPEEPEESVL
jgi:hypothetical protein